MMDAKNIYIACSHMRAKVNWEKHLGNEWSFIGDGAGFKEAEVQAKISEFFPDDEIYLVIDRHRAFPISTATAASKVKESLNNQDVTLCNKAFRKMIVFSCIGVVKHGEIDS